MVINNKITFRRKHRHMLYGVLCLVLISVAVAAAGLLPTQIDDAESTESEGDYTLNGGVYNDEKSADLGNLITKINSSASSKFTITVGSDDTNFSGYTLNGGKEVTLSSSSDKPFTLTTSTEDKRHFTIASGGILTLENIILDGNDIGGGIMVQASGELIMKDGVVIQNCSAGRGGGVYNDGKFTMNGSVISGNKAIGYFANGGVYNAGMFTMTNSTISDNTSKGYGSYGGVFNDKGTFTMTNSTISDNTSEGDFSRGGGVYNWGGNFKMIGSTISGNTTEGYGSNGGGVYNSGTFTMTGSTISGNTVEGNVPRGGGVYNNEGATFEMTGSTISGNTAKGENSNGGGVHNYFGTITMTGSTISGNTVEGGNSEGGGVHNAGPFTMTGSTISGNTAKGDGSSGGGVHNSGYLIEFKMTDSTISGNTAKGENSRGGGVHNYYGTFTMTDSTISGNTAKGDGSSGGGVCNFNGTFTMSGSDVCGNTAKGDGSSGGGVHNSGYSTEFKMTDSTISGNTAKGGGSSGGGVFNTSMFTMSGGEISDNTAIRGGGIYNDKTGTPYITGGRISGNTAAGADENGSGGGIYTEDFTKLKVGDGVVFSGNTAPMLRTNNVNVNHANAYAANIGKVVLDEWVNAVKNAPAYNNFDINYPGDAYVVFIEIAPNGSGTVTVTDNAGGTEVFPLEDGRIHVPVGVSWITLSAEPETGYELVQFTKDGLKIDDPTNVEVIGNMKIIAEFKLINYFVTATSDNGSIITPSGTMNVLYGENKTFTFSAKPGYRITAIFVDDVPLLSEELASGEYIFLDVKSNHEIHVKSEADGGSGGSETGTGPGNGNNTGPGSDGGKGDIEGGNGNGSENVGSGPGINESLSGGWSVLGMICATLALITGMIAVAAGKDRFRTDGEKRSKTGMTLRVTALVIGLVSVAAFFLTEDRGLSAAAFGEWTLLMFVLFLAALILTMVSFRFDETDG